MAKSKEDEGNPFESPAGDDEDTVEVSVSEESSDGDGEEGESRKERRQARGRERWNEREREIGDLRSANADQQARIARLEQQVAESNRRQQDSQRGDGDKELDDVWEQRANLASEYQRIDPKQMTPELRKQYMDRAKKLEIKQADLLAERAASKHRQPAEDPRIVALRVKHSDVMGDPTKWEAAQMYYNDKVRKGEREGPELIEKAMAYARGFSLDTSRRQAQASDTDRQRHVGPPASGARGSREDAPTTVRLTKHDMKMADAMYSHIPEEKRYQHFHKEILSKKEKNTEHA